MYPPDRLLMSNPSLIQWLEGDSNRAQINVRNQHGGSKYCKNDEESRSREDVGLVMDLGSHDFRLYRIFFCLHDVEMIEENLGTNANSHLSTKFFYRAAPRMGLSEIREDL